MCEIRKVSDTGSGSGRVTVPKETLREMGLVDDDGNIIEGHLAFEETDDGSARVEPVQ
ncbi:hypothetical protein [Halorubrum sp. Ea1]|jgi:bifunctional DNA-binding transcriptional regulator/antitoxin component of YhaV-PrlF toxin-antitoxin module|uniref:hypothetical protein n=1 Tax=Halorubrum sp. Ea1 TaxID=1480718 RepID=UPI0015958E80|nr:hypothetical protein [Halorubrum sp. Ea1]